jgi:hypothetical protein
MTHPQPVQHEGPNAPGAGGQTGPEAFAGPFTLREVTLGASVLVIFLGSVLPFVQRNGAYGNLWNSFSLFFLGLGIVLPLVAAALVAAQRLSTARLRVGSLSADQFASVAAALAVAFFFLQTVNRFNAGPFVALLGSLGFLGATVLAPRLPFFKADFSGRADVPAHAVARQPAPARPKAARPVPAEQVRHWNDPGPAAVGPTATADPSAYSTITGTRPPAPATDATVPLNSSVLAGAGAVPGTEGHGLDADAAEGPTGAANGAGQGPAGADQAVVEAFWFAVGTSRPVVDERTGQQLFVLEPGNWEVGIEDRGSEFLVQDKRTGQVGVLRDLTNIERAPREHA